MNEVSNPTPEISRAARRRYLTVLFSDLSESTRLAAAMEAEDYADLLSRLRRAYELVIPKHGGTIVRVQGDGLLAIFGYPHAREDDGRRATETALELHEIVRAIRLETPLAGRSALGLHTGIHAGLVLLNEGDVVRGRFELLGNAPNVAARLSDAAGDDEILVSEETLGAERHFFETGERRRLSVKGLSEPVGVYRIDARAPVTTRLAARARRGLVPFIGRQPELRMLDDLLHGLLAGVPCSVAVTAPAGLGKTRLIEEFLRRASAADCRILRGYCESYLGAEPLQPFLQILRSVCGLEHRMPAALAAQALEDALLRIDPALLRHRAEFLRALSLTAGIQPAPPAPQNTTAALRDLVAALAAWKPLVLFIDDWQWADDASRQVLDAIRVLERRAVFILVATRGFAAGDASMSAARILELAPFSEAEASETIARLLPHSDPFVSSEILKYSGGNPLFIEELCHSATYEDGSRRLSRGAGGAAWLNSLIESRVARLPDAQAELVRAAAVIGNVIPAWLLEEITGCGERHSLVRGLADEDFIFPAEAPGVLRFKHGITRDVVYAAVGLHQRRAMHLRIADALRERVSGTGEEELYEALAYHYGAGGQAAQAARYAELAGDKAMAAAALDRAQTQYRAALVALDEVEPSEDNYRRWSRIAQRLGMACVFDPAREQLPILQRAVEVARAHDDAVGIASAEYWLGYINYGLGESRVAIRHCERALEAAQRASDEPLKVQIAATLGQAKAAACDYDRALALLDEAISIKRQHRSGSRPAIGSAYSLACKASILGDRGHFAQAHACFDEALEALRGGNKVVEGSVLCWRSGVCLWQGRWEEALRSAEEARRIAERVKSLYVYAMSRALGAYAAWMRERAPLALQTIIDATSWLEARDKRLFISLNYGWLADAMATSGRFEEAREHAARALARAREHDRLGEAMACRALARAAAQGHGRKPPERYLALATKSAAAKGSRHDIAVTQLCHAEIELGRGNREAAAALLDQAQSAFEAMDMAWHLKQACALREGP